MSKLAAGRKELTIGEMLELKMPNKKKVRLMLHMLTNEQLVDFVRACAKRTHEYLYNVQLVYDNVDEDVKQAERQAAVRDNYYLVITAMNAAFWAHLAARNSAGCHPMERQAQLDWLKEALHVNH